MTASALQIAVPPGFSAWRDLARQALLNRLSPEEVSFVDEAAEAASAGSLFGGAPQSSLPPANPRTIPEAATPHVPAAYLSRANIVACHRDPERWNLLYRLLWRLQTDGDLLRVEVDADVAEMLRMHAQVRRDEHKMHAFVRFRRVEDERGEVFIAWYEPQHRILELAAPFFRERFGPMRWSILTPDGTAVWDPADGELRFGPPIDRSQAPAADGMEDLWRSYYGSIFNPGRLNTDLMRSHMPRRFWGNLPEVDILPTLVANAQRRVQGMVTIQKSKPTAEPYLPEKRTISAIRAALPGCRGCDLYCNATQVVAGRGPAHASIVLVGEQPGEQEDLQGEPFVGPAGGVLRKAMTEAGMDASDVYLTNAVKHFKFVLRGRRRIHQSPRMSEILACRPWLLAEIEALRPRLVVCLGASASKSLLGGTFALMRDRGKLIETPFAANVLATLHPSAILRARDEESRREMYRMLLQDLVAANRFAAKAA